MILTTIGGGGYVTSFDHHVLFRRAPILGSGLHIRHADADLTKKQKQQHAAAHPPGDYR